MSASPTVQLGWNTQKRAINELVAKGYVEKINRRRSKAARPQICISANGRKKRVHDQGNSIPLGRGLWYGSMRTVLKFKSEKYIA